MSPLLSPPPEPLLPRLSDSAASGSSPFRSSDAGEEEAALNKLRRRTRKL